MLTGSDLSPCLTCGGLEFGSSVSIDGRYLLFVDPMRDAPSIRDLLNGQTRRLGNPTSDRSLSVDYAFLSHDGSRLAYSWRSGTDQRLRIMPLEQGSAFREILRSTPEVTKYNPKGWFPDGRRLLVELQRADQTWQFAVVDTESGSLRVLESTGWRRQIAPFWNLRVSLSPDGRFLAYPALATDPKSATVTPQEAEDLRMYVLATDGSIKHELSAAGPRTYSPAWSADGSHLLFFSSHDTTDTLDLLGLRMENGRATEAPFLIKGNIGSRGDLFPIGMTAQGDFFYTSFGRSLIRVAVHSLENGGAPAKAPGITLTGNYPAWSHDGRKLALVTPQGTITVVSSGGQPTHYSLGLKQARIDSRPLWFHRQNALILPVVHYGQHGADRSLVRLDLSTGRSEEVGSVGRFVGRGALFAALGQDDRTLFVRGDVVRRALSADGPERVLPKLNRITAVDLANGEQGLIIEVPEPQVISDIALSPDGTRLAFYTHVFPDERITLAVGNVPDGTFKTLQPGIEQRDVLFKLAWHRDAQHLLIAQSDTTGVSEVLKVALANGQRQATGVRVHNLVSFAPAPDMSQIAVSSSTTGIEWWAVNVRNVLANSTGPGSNESPRSRR